MCPNTSLRSTIVLLACIKFTGIKLVTLSKGKGDWDRRIQKKRDSMDFLLKDVIVHRFQSAAELQLLPVVAWSSCRGNGS